MVWSRLGRGQLSLVPTPQSPPHHSISNLISPSNTTLTHHCLSGSTQGQVMRGHWSPHFISVRRPDPHTRSGHRGGRGQKFHLTGWREYMGKLMLTSWWLFLWRLAIRFKFANMHPSRKGSSSCRCPVWESGYVWLFGRNSITEYVLSCQMMKESYRNL